MNSRHLPWVAAALTLLPATMAQPASFPDNLAQSASRFEAPDLSTKIKIRRPVRDPSSAVVLEPFEARVVRPFSAAFTSGVGHNSNPLRLNQADGGAFVYARLDGVRRFNWRDTSFSFSSSIDLFEFDRGDPNSNMLDFQIGQSIERALPKDIQLTSVLKGDVFRVNNRDLARYLRWTGDFARAWGATVRGGLRLMTELRDDRRPAGDPNADRDAFRGAIGPTLGLDLPGARGGVVTLAYARGTVSAQGADEDLKQHNFSIKLTNWDFNQWLFLESAEATLEHRRSDRLQSRLPTAHRTDDEWNLNSTFLWKPSNAWRLPFGRRNTPCLLRLGLSYANQDTNLAGLKFHQFSGSVKFCLSL